MIAPDGRYIWLMHDGIWSDSSRTNFNWESNKFHEVIELTKKEVFLEML